MNPTVLAIIEMVPLTAAVVFYWKRAMNLSWDGRPIPAWRQACFGTGLFLAAFVMFNPFGYLADELVIAHMVEHLVLSDIASLFIVLGLTKSILQPILALPVIGRLQVLANPFVAFPLWAANLFIWHIPALYDAAWGSSLAHGLEHAMFLGFGILMWMPVFGPLPVPSWFGPGAKLIYVVAVRFTAAILGNVLMWTQVTLYESYAAGQAKWGLTAVADQSIAGVIMMIEGTFLIFGVLGWTFFESARQSTRKQELIDLAWSEGIELDPERADRAVKAGHGDLLERRIRSGEIRRSVTG